MQVGLEQPELSGSVTGKFVLYVHENDDLDKRLGLRVELAQVWLRLREVVRMIFVASVCSLSSCNDPALNTLLPFCTHQGMRPQTLLGPDHVHVSPT